MTCESRGELGVVAIDVGEGDELAGLVDARGEIRHVDGELLFDLHFEALAARDLAGDALGRPAAIVGEDDFGQTLWVVHAHAAVTERAHGLGEQLALRRVVHVDVVAVGEAEFHDAEHVGAAGRLDERVGARIGPGPVDLGGVDRAAVIAHAQIMALKDAGIGHGGAEAEEVVALGLAAQRREDFLHLDAVGHAPFGVEDHELHVGREDRGRRVGLADDDLFLMHQLAGVIDAGRVLGDIILDVECAHVGGQPAPAFHVEGDAFDVAGGVGRGGGLLLFAAAVEGGSGCARDHAVGVEAVLVLERFDRANERLVVDGFTARGGGHT